MPEIETVSREQVVETDQNEEIARIAYHYWETRGGEDGHALEDWLMAEKEVLRRRNIPAMREDRGKRVSTAA